MSLLWQSHGLMLVACGPPSRGGGLPARRVDTGRVAQGQSLSRALEPSRGTPPFRSPAPLSCHGPGGGRNGRVTSAGPGVLSHRKTDLDGAPIPTQLRPVRVWQSCRGSQRRGNGALCSAACLSCEGHKRFWVRLTILTPHFCPSKLAPLITCLHPAPCDSAVTGGAS